MITLKSSDNKFFEIHESVAKQSKTIQEYMENDSSDVIQMQINAFPVQVSSDILIKVIEYCKRHVDTDSPTADDRSVPADDRSVPADDRSVPADDRSVPADDISVLPSSSYSIHTLEDLKRIGKNFIKVDWSNRSVSSFSSSSVTESESDDLKEFDKNFVKVDWNVLMGITIAAHFLNIIGLFNLTSQALADYIKDKTPEEIRILLDMKNDFTQEEEEVIRRENAWVFE